MTAGTGVRDTVSPKEAPISLSGTKDSAEAILRFIVGSTIKNDALDQLTEVVGGVRDIIDGMADSARNGTASSLARQGLHQSFLAKTGTAVCIHKAHAPVDGFVVVAWPADFPRYILMVRQHGVTGAQAAVLAAHMLRDLEP